MFTANLNIFPYLEKSQIYTTMLNSSRELFAFFLFRWFISNF